MPYFAKTESVAAGGSATPLQNWTYRTPQRDAQIEILINASAVGLTFNYTSGAELIVQAATPVSGGGTAGVLPARINSEAIVDRVAQGDEQVLTVSNPTLGAITYNLVLVETYLGK